MSCQRLTRPRIASALAVVVASALVIGLPGATDAQPSIGQLSTQLSASNARAGSLAASVAQLSALIGRLSAQIAGVQSREAEVQAQLAADRAALARVQAALARERAWLVVLRRRLARARAALAAQLVSSYESDPPDLVRVVLEARGFNDLLEQVAFLHRAMDQQQALISVTRAAKSQADAAARRLAELQSQDRAATQSAALQAAALAGMNTLLRDRQAALARARAAQQDALAAARARGAQLRREISKLQAEQAAAARAAADAFSGGPALGASSGWAIPYAIVLCESGGQNLPPNSAGASGYYQIISATWRMFGGSGPAAYLASKAEQDVVAARIYRGGAGVSNWSCAAILGIH
jgi:septal ring factor EnvC (AmiA/AmiB activator)